MNHGTTKTNNIMRNDVISFMSAFPILYIIEFAYAKYYIFLTVRGIQLRPSSFIFTSFVMLPQFLRLEN